MLFDVLGNLSIYANSINKIQQDAEHSEPIKLHPDLKFHIFRTTYRGHAEQTLLFVVEDQLCGQHFENEILYQTDIDGNYKKKEEKS